MANPNLVGASVIRGQSSARKYVTTIPAILLENSSSSDEILKVNSISISNVDGLNEHDITIQLVRDSVAYRVLSTVKVPADSTLVAVTQEIGFYLLEGDRLEILGSVSNKLNVICSYEQMAESSVPDRQDIETVPAGDTFFNNVVLLITANGDNAATNNTFIDSGPYGLTVNSVGITAQGTFNPYGDGWSNYFDGNGDYISIPDNVGFDYGSGNFTVEFWMYPLTAKTSQIYDHANSPASGVAGLSVNFNTNSTVTAGQSFGVAYATSAAVALNSWHHVAVVRNGTAWTIYINGVSSGTGSSAVNLTATGPVTIGGNARNTAESFNGYISNLRVVKGTAVYTSNFTPPTTPLSAIPDTSLLTCQSNRFVDNSTNKFSITPAGNASVQKFAPISDITLSGSMYFDTGDCLTIADSPVFDLPGDFTCEFWIYPVATAGTSPVSLASIALGSESSGRNGFNIFALAGSNNTMGVYVNGANLISVTNAVRIGEWQHIAVTRQVSTVRFFLNGTLRGSGTTSVSFTGADGNGFAIGAAYITSYNTSRSNGHYSDVRLVNGISLYNENFTPPTNPLTPIDNTAVLLSATNASVFDSVGKGNWETVGGVELRTDIKKYGTASVYFDGAANTRLLQRYSPLYDLATEDFTFEAWIYPTRANTTGTRIFCTGGGTASWNATTGIHVLIQTFSGTTSGGILDFQIANGTTTPISVDSIDVVPINQWSFITVCLLGSTAYVGVNGNVVSGSVAGRIRPSTNPTINLGNIPGQSVSTLTYEGYMDDIRITKGVARYTANFTPPTQELPTY